MTLPHTPEDDHPSHTPALRWMANMLSLWALCAKPACRRARRCNKEPRDCLTRFMPLVPEEVREGIKAMLEGLRYDLSYDDVRDDALEEITALEEWKALVQTSVGVRPVTPASPIHDKIAGNS